jgi:hypothetical protein
LEFKTLDPLTHLILMTGGGFSDELQPVWDEMDLPMLYKPFLAQDVVNLVKGRLTKARSATG